MVRIGQIVSFSISWQRPRGGFLYWGHLHPFAPSGSDAPQEEGGLRRSDLAKNVVIIECVEVAAASTFWFHGLKTSGFSLRYFSYLPIFLVHLDAFPISAGPVELQIAASEPMSCLLVYLVFNGESDRLGIQLHCAQSQSPGCREKDFDG